MAAFRKHCGPKHCARSLNLPEEDADTLPDHIRLGMAMFFGDIVESLNCFLKQAFNKHTLGGKRGRGQKVADTVVFGLFHRLMP